jgi:hypothetical protein
MDCKSGQESSGTRHEDRRVDEASSHAIVRVDLDRELGGPFQHLDVLVIQRRLCLERRHRSDVADCLSGLHVGLGVCLGNGLAAPGHDFRQTEASDGDERSQREKHKRKLPATVQRDPNADHKGDKVVHSVADLQAKGPLSSSAALDS